jgi:hypothetical protein
MTPIDYNSLLIDGFSEFTDLLIQQRDLDFTVSQKEQWLRATVNMLKDEDRRIWNGILDDLGSDAGLSSAVRQVLKSEPKKFHTATGVKKTLEKISFDFTGYTTNPLPSIHAALRRLKDDEAEMQKIDGVMAWRWIKPIPMAIPEVQARPVRIIRRVATPSQRAVESRGEITRKIDDAMKAIEKTFGFKESEEKK